jgi:cytochrome P450/NADPH-cytochrome P450 reductase
MTAKKLPIPQPPKIPIIGNLRQVDFDAPVQSFIRLAQRYGELYRLSFFGTDLLLASTHELVQELCDESRFRKVVPPALVELRVMVGNALFTAETDDPVWGQAHRILMPAFGALSMRDHFPTMVRVAEALLAKWERLDSQAEVHVADDMTRLTLDTIGLCGFGYDFDSFAQEEIHPFIAAMLRAMREGLERSARHPLQNHLMIGKRLQFDADLKLLNDTVDQVIRERKAAPLPSGTKKDLLSLMLDGVDKQTGGRLDDENVRHQIITFLIAGHETTSGLLAFAVQFLLKHPQVMERARAEADRVLGQRPGGRPEFEDVARLAYTAQILKETLRLFPTAPAWVVGPLQDTDLGGRYLVPKGLPVVVLAGMLHRDPAVWGKNVEVFDPDRFAPEAERARPPTAYKPFGNGQRACIGSQFAMQEATLALAMVLHRFELIDHTNYQLRIKENLTHKPDDLRIRIKARGRGMPGSTQRPAPVAGTPARPRSVGESTRARSHGTPLLVLFASNTGTAEEFAGRIAADAAHQGYHVTMASLDEHVGKLPQSGGVIILTASYNGLAPDNGRAFVAWLQRGPGDLRGVRYQVFGCGHRDWASTYQAVPILIDEALANAGAERLGPRGEGDARGDVTGDFQAWYGDLWRQLAAAFELEAGAMPQGERPPLYQIELVESRQENPFIAAHGARPVTIRANRELQNHRGPSPSQRSTRHVEVALPAGMSYRVGDHLGVIARNSPELVARVLKRFGLDSKMILMLRQSTAGRSALPTDRPLAVVDLLGELVELQDVASREHVLVLAKYTDCPPEKARLLALAGSGLGPDGVYDEQILGKRLSVLDLLEEFRACQLPFNVFLEMLPTLKPRYYSISSSPRAKAGGGDGAFASITVAVVEAPARSGKGSYRGVCSTYLASQRDGATVHAFVREASPRFHLPADASRPLIMVGPGTGFGPFRGFLQERLALEQAGKSIGASLLFYGCRHPDEDYIYKDELAAFVAAGIVTVHTAFSLFDSSWAAAEAQRLGAAFVPPQGQFVQDQIRVHGDEVLRLLDAGGYFYVCGDASRMEPAVRQTLVDLLKASKAGGKAERAEVLFRALESEGRYAKDVWAPNK